MKRVLALDSGALRCGIAVISQGPIYIHSEIFGVERGQDRYQDYRLRLVEAFGEKASCLLDVYDPDVVVSEIIPVAGSSRASAQRQLAATAVTAFQAVAMQKGYICEQIAATTVKKVLTGNGHATKIGVRNAVVGILPDLRNKLVANKTHSDESDALAIALSYAKQTLKWQI